MRALSLFAIATSGCAWVCSDASLYLEPWPDERLRAADGTIDISSFPEGTGSPLRDAMVRQLEGADGFGLASAVYFPMDGPIDASLPSPAESMREDASVFLMNVDPASAELGQRMAVEVRFAEDSGPFGVPNLLSVLPVPGIPLAPSTTYAAVVTTRVRSQEYGNARSDAHRHALAELERAGVDVEKIASLAVFRTGDPLARLRDAAVSEPSLSQDAPLELIETHANYCVFGSTLSIPVFQRGEPPYLLSGGGFDPSVERVETARIFVTLPRVERPHYPVAVFVRTGGGGDRPLIDRGPRDASGTSIPGTGPAVHLARAGFAGVMVDGPLGGVRNRAGWDEQFVVMNTANLEALEGNVIQSALELVMIARFLDSIAIDARACDGASADARLDGEHVALIGHSMGATIAPLAAAIEPRYGALIMSGAGASWIRQVMYKESPVNGRFAAELMLGYPLHGAELTTHDPILSLLQWAGERSDPLLFGRAVLEHDTHVLVFQGLLDHYIPPPISNPLALSLDVDLAGDVLDADYDFALRDDLVLRGGTVLPLPLSGNRGAATRAVVQHGEDGIEDGHEVLFQLPGAQRQLRCFLESFATGVPVVVPPGDPTSGQASCW